jgi:hypothetical protein
MNQNCWFCNTQNSVSIFKRNSWHCNNCTQYNGFTKDGDYNKIIPEMYSNKNKKIFSNNTSTTTTTSRRTSQNYNLNNNNNNNTNGLCEKCNLNQELKLIKLTNYESKNEDTYDFEIEMYKDYLDKLYDLCDTCKSKVKFEIRKQDGILKQYLFKLGKLV